MTNHRPLPDPNALAAQLRLWVAELVVWLAEMLGAGEPCARLRAWAHTELDRAEWGAKVIVTLAALQQLPAELDVRRRGGRRPLSCPRGFRRVRTSDNGMRSATRGLFPRERDLARRAARLDTFLSRLDIHAARVARHIDRIVPASRLVGVAPPPARLDPGEPSALEATDTS